MGIVMTDSEVMRRACDLCRQSGNDPYAPVRTQLKGAMWAMLPMWRRYEDEARLELIGQARTTGAMVYERPTIEGRSKGRA